MSNARRTKQRNAGKLTRPRDQWHPTARATYAPAGMLPALNAGAEPATWPGQPGPVRKGGRGRGGMTSNASKRTSR